MKKFKGIAFAILVASALGFASCSDDDDTVTEIVEVPTYIGKETVASSGLKGLVKTVEVKKYDATLKADSTLVPNDVRSKVVTYFDKGGIYAGVENFTLLDAKTETFRANDSKLYELDKLQRDLVISFRNYRYTGISAKVDSIYISKKVFEYDDTNKKATVREYISSNEGVRPLELAAKYIYNLKPDGTVDDNGAVDVWRPKASEDDNLGLTFKTEMVAIMKDHRDNWTMGYTTSKSYNNKGEITYFSAMNYSKRVITYWD